MTQKSASRIARDAEKKRVENYHKTNTVWDDLNVLNSQIRLQLSKLIAIVDAGRDERLRTFVVDKARLAQQIALLTKDLSSYLNELNALNAEHSSRTGGASDPDSYFQAINLYHRYELLSVHIQQILASTATEITAAFVEATTLMNTYDAHMALKAQTANVQEELIDKNVVSDLPVKEVSATQQEPATTVLK